MGTKKISPKIIVIIAAFLALPLAGSLILPHHTGSHLIIADSQGQIHHRIPVATEEVFTLSYRHSVSNSVVSGTFAITSAGTIHPLTTTFSTFGPGLPMAGELVETTIEDGLITVHHQEEPREVLRLWVSPLTGETLSIGSRSVDLYQISPEPTLVEIRFEKK
ncbi:DUF1850 domain-containing protein [Dethiobacter alkaliphilus]|uniref:DUF1850 domain-containing protein n=1 Tax=Dethiobacter alkaliphilus TaxID=427926 RepID=UPI002226DCD3|nr:DUF1850 domain-containing protein [Dethiobacter alkaliphilus]MCW3491679.1 DUF1850 domain-containing protein [Dethiobacter alkaliphilus]